MNNIANYTIEEIAIFNPTLTIEKGSIVKKIPMNYIQIFNRKIIGYEMEAYNSGPKFQNGDVLLAKITPCLENGKTAYVDILNSEEIAFGSSEFIVLRAKNVLESEFLYYLSISPTFRKRAISSMEGTSGRKRVNERALKCFKLPMPKPSVRPKIARKLSLLDQKIELNNKINSELEAMAKTLYDYWFVQFDFPNEEGKPYKSSGGAMEWNEELKREIPVGWDNGTLSNISDIVRGVSYNKDDILCSTSPNTTPILRATNITGNKLDLNDMVYIPNEFVSEKQLLNKFEILLTMSSGSKEHIGKNGLFLYDKKVAFGAFCAKLVAKQNFQFFLYEFTQSNNYFNTIKNVCLGTNINNLNGPLVMGFETVIPKEDVLIGFNNKVVPIFEKIRLNILENQELASLRDWLLPMLMNGQVSVE